MLDLQARLWRQYSKISKHLLEQISNVDQALLSLNWLGAVRGTNFVAQEVLGPMFHVLDGPIGPSSQPPPCQKAVSLHFHGAGVKLQTHLSYVEMCLALYNE